MGLRSVFVIPEQFHKAGKGRSGNDVLVRHASADSTPGNRGRNPFLKFAELLFYEFHESFASLLSIDAVPALAIPFFRMFPCRLPAYTPQSVTPNLSEEIHVHRIA